jgi:hypothetical protein
MCTGVALVVPVSIVAVDAASLISVGTLLGPINTPGSTVYVPGPAVVADRVARDLKALPGAAYQPCRSSLFRAISLCSVRWRWRRVARLDVGRTLATVLRAVMQWPSPSRRTLSISTSSTSPLAPRCGAAHGRGDRGSCARLLPVGAADHLGRRDHQRTGPDSRRCAHRRPRQRA